MAQDQVQPVPSNQSEHAQVIDLLGKAAEERLATGTPPSEETSQASVELPEEAEVLEEEVVVEEVVEEVDEPAQTVEAAVLAEMFGVDESDLIIEDGQPIGIRTKVDGKDGITSVTDLRKSYQLQKHTTDKANQLRDERNAWEEEKAGQQAQLKTSLEHAGHVLAREENALLDEYNHVDWNQLEQTDAAQWSVLRQKYSERFNAIKGAQNQAAEAYHKNQESQQQEFEANRAKYKAEQYELLMEVVPQWRDKEVAQRESIALAEFANEQGYSTEEVDQIMDHRALHILRMAWLYKRGITSATAAVKKVAHLPRVNKPGGAPAPEQVKREALEKNRAVAIKGDMQQKQNYVSNLIS